MSAYDTRTGRVAWSFGAGGAVEPHPAVHAGILADRDNEAHLQALADHAITAVDLVVVNLYPFRDTIADPDVTRAAAIEMIDIGGPTMVRAAAKNHRHVGVVT